VCASQKAKQKPKEKRLNSIGKSSTTIFFLNIIRTGCTISGRIFIFAKLKKYIIYPSPNQHRVAIMIISTTPVTDATAFFFGISTGNHIFFHLINFSYVS